MFETAETRWAAAAARAFRDVDVPPYLFAARLNLAADQPYVDPVGRAKAPVVHARVNHGVWQARCPFCPSAQHASEDGLFYCAHCLNASCGHKTLPLVFPRNRPAVETQLLERPEPRFRNWEPGETINDLKKQDKEAADVELDHSSRSERR